jgi:hypothetical protein
LQRGLCRLDPGSFGSELGFACCGLGLAGPERRGGSVERALCVGRLLLAIGELPLGLSELALRGLEALLAVVERGLPLVVAFLRRRKTVFGALGRGLSRFKLR